MWKCKYLKSLIHRKSEITWTFLEIENVEAVTFKSLSPCWTVEGLLWHFTHSTISCDSQKPLTVLNCRSPISEKPSAGCWSTTIIIASPRRPPVLGKGQIYMLGRGLSEVTHKIINNHVQYCISSILTLSCSPSYLPDSHCDACSSCTAGPRSASSTSSGGERSPPHCRSGASRRQTASQSCFRSAPDSTPSCCVGQESPFFTLIHPSPELEFHLLHLNQPDIDNLPRRLLRTDWASDEAPTVWTILLWTQMLNKRANVTFKCSMVWCNQQAIMQ